MKKHRLVKLKSQAGESIAEVLIALLISSLALVMLASMISSTQRMVATSTKKMAEYYEANNKLEKFERVDPEDAEEIDVIISIEDSTVTFSASFEDIPLFVNNKLGTEVYAYGSTGTNG